MYNTDNSLGLSQGDATPLFEYFRGEYATQLLAAAVVEFDLFNRLGSGSSLAPDMLRQDLKLASRPFAVLMTAMRAMRLVSLDSNGHFQLTEFAREFLVAQSEFDLTGYIGLAGQSAGVRAVIEHLRTNRPVGARPQDVLRDPSETPRGVGFIYREGMDSAMEAEASARRLTLSLAGRARIVAPLLAARVPLPEGAQLIDVGGGSGLYAIAYLAADPTVSAVVWDRPEVLKIASELAHRHGVADRLTCESGDMFTDPIPSGDVYLLSNILHDWDVPECECLLARLAEAIPEEGRLIVHDVFLDDDLGGPLPIALYSAALFTLTEGRAYSAAEYRAWLDKAGLITGSAIIPTAIHCGALVASPRKARRTDFP
jgi:hypothetical protein